MTRATKQQWIEEAFRLLIEQGQSALSAEKIGKRLGVSRGSFYHHFASKDGFYQAILETWYENSTIGTVAKNKSLEGETRLEKLRYFAWAINHELDVAIRAWSLHSPQARAFQERVDQDRLAYLEEVYSESFQTEQNAERVSIAAKVAYLSFIGVQSFQPKFDGEKVEHFRNSLHEVITRYLGTN
ncbi:TetR/AcrR family transcriptional regulator [Pseudoalteromonas rubra]|uniref:TetR/AcrR family transcriptional regulator n=1 Tax=Pseudoalteromonas rubra TaxID=43658 RepID=UPI0006969A0F|nr:TetR/AcrR family transcriptional regulator [Pseudoalteromonas rubra]